MPTWDNIPGIYKGVATVVVLTVLGLNYHTKFMLSAVADGQHEVLKTRMIQQQVATNNQIQYLLVLNMEDKKEILIKRKSKAVADNKVAEAETLEQEIQTLRDRIKGLCDQLDDC